MQEVQEGMQQQAESLVSKLIQKISQEKDIDGALAMLSEIYPEQDIASLQQDLEQLIFASDVLGRLSTHEGRKRG